MQMRTESKPMVRKTVATEVRMGSDGPGRRKDYIRHYTILSNLLPFVSEHTGLSVKCD